jgi:hypothetical protein
MEYKIIEDKNSKSIVSDNYHMVFNKKTGYTITYGKDMNENAPYCPLGPIIMDIEVMAGKCIGCDFCYKSNNPDKPANDMTLERFENLFDKFPRTLTQIALGITTLPNDPNHPLWSILRYCRDNTYQEVIPNMTINGIIKDWQAAYLATYCGAIAVSNYDIKTTKDAVYKLHKEGMKQINIHQLLSDNTVDSAIELLNTIKDDAILRKIDAVIFLTVKNKGEAKNQQLPTKTDYLRILQTALDNKINFGFDSCGAHVFLENFNNVMDNTTAEMNQLVTPCESCRESYYIDVNGNGHSCSFNDHSEPINVHEAKDFIKDVWNNEITVNFRNNLLKTSCKCPIFNIKLKEEVK